MATRELQDHYFKLAKREGYRARAAYKLIEIADKKRLIKKGDRVLDCGAAPGSWMQVAAKRVGPKGVVVGIDLSPIDTIPGDNIHAIEDDFTTISPAALRGSARFDVVLSDMAPNTTGDRTIDHFGSVRLVQAVLDHCGELLAPGGAVVLKVFEGEAYPDLLASMRATFTRVKGFKPAASRAVSTEMYLIGEGFEG